MQKRKTIYALFALIACLTIGCSSGSGFHDYNDAETTAARNAWDSGKKAAGATFDTTKTAYCNMTLLSMHAMWYDLVFNGYESGGITINGKVEWHIQYALSNENNEHTVSYNGTLSLSGGTEVISITLKYSYTGSPEIYSGTVSFAYDDGTTWTLDYDNGSFTRD
jgi:hypothetical protein